jgi:two-component system sensor histidine kinase CpxA
LAEGDPLSTETEPIALNEVLLEVVDDCRVEADAHGCFIAIEGEKQHITIPGNRELLRRALENIVRNAIRYTPHGSIVEVKLDVTVHAASICVRDFGPGVPDSALTEIFRPFFRVDDSRNKSTGGIGLGLAIAQRAITLHHGHLRAENMHPGLAVTAEFPHDKSLA